MFNKFVLYKDSILMSHVKYHRDIVPHDVQNIKGGGGFNINRDANTCLFFGDSHEFGSVSYEKLQQCINAQKVFLDTNPQQNISKQYKFTYHTGSEIIPIK